MDLCVRVPRLPQLGETVTGEALGVLSNGLLLMGVSDFQRAMITGA
ncbi:hypothetical protein V6U79_08830 [Micromonospora sp. CPCC 205556]